MQELTLIDGNNERPIEGAKVIFSKIINAGGFPVPKKLAEGFTDKNGYFKYNGNDATLLSYEPAGFPPETVPVESDWHYRMYYWKIPSTKKPPLFLFIALLLLILFIMYKNKI